MNRVQRFLKYMLCAFVCFLSFGLSVSALTKTYEWIIDYTEAVIKNCIDSSTIVCVSENDLGLGFNELRKKSENHRCCWKDYIQTENSYTNHLIGITSVVFRLAFK